MSSAKEVQAFAGLKFLVRIGASVVSAMLATMQVEMTQLASHEIVHS